MTFSKSILTVGLVFYAAIAALPFLTKNQFFLNSMIFVLVFALFAASWDIGYGVAGVINLGPGVAFGIGSYVFVLLAVSHYSPFVALLVASGTASLAGFIYWIPALRTSGTYLATVTLILLLLSGELALSLTGEDGFSAGIAYFSPSLIQSYYSTLAIALMGTLVLFFLSYSRFGLRLKAMRDDEVAAKSVGINVYFYKLVALIISSFFLGLSGACSAYFIYHAHFDYTIFSITTNFLGIVIAIIGGPATIFGSVIGALIVELPANYLTSYSIYAVIGYGVTMVLVVLFLRNGILNALTALTTKLVSKREARESLAAKELAASAPGSGDTTLHETENG